MVCSVQAFHCRLCCMPTLDQLRLHFEKNLTEKLGALEKRRLALLERHSYRTYKRLLLLMAVVSIVLIIGGIILPASPLKWGAGMVPLTALVAIVYPIVISVRRQKVMGSLVDEYRLTVMNSLLPCAAEELQYKLVGTLTPADVDNTLLFEGPVDLYTLEDAVESRVPREFMMTRVILEERRRSTTSNSRYLTAADGLLIQCTNAESVPGFTVIHPGEFAEVQTRDGLIGSLAKHLDAALTSMTPGAVPVEHEEFSKYFKVLSSDPRDAMRVLTPHRTQWLTSFRKRIGIPVSFSFVGDSISAAIDGTGLGSIDYTVTFLSFSHFEEYLKSLLLALELAKGASQK